MDLPALIKEATPQGLEIVAGVSFAVFAISYVIYYFVRTEQQTMGRTSSFPKLFDETIHCSYESMILPSSSSVSPSPSSNHSSYGSLSPKKGGKTLSPVLIFINSKAGAGEGLVIKNMFLNSFLSPQQIVDLSQSNGEDALRYFHKNYPLTSRILVCGGDGTVNSILAAQKKLNISIAIAILPLGTGNDLAIALRWAGRNGGYLNDTVDTILQQVKIANLQKLDRWCLANSYLGSFAALRSGLSARKNINFTNYFSCGVDAQAALDFHRARSQNPAAFFSRLVNKMYYTLFGLKILFFQERHLNFKEIVEITCDGRVLDIPDDSKGIIILNINSYAGGCRLWKDVNSGETHFDNSAVDDRLLEVVAINSSLHLGKWQLGVSQPRHLAQGSAIRVVTHRPIACHVDGEPWEQMVGTIDIAFAEQVDFLVPAPQELNTEMLKQVLQWAVEKRKITEAAKQDIDRELSKRLKTPSYTQSE